MFSSVISPADVERWSTVMGHSISTFFRLFVSTLRGTETPRQLASGVAIGMLIGLIPNDSLLVPVLITVVLATHVNLFAAAVSAIAFSWIGFLCDDLLHRLGAQLLTLPSLQSTFIWASEAPLLPWTRFNNTVVAGSVLLGVCLLYPCYHLSSQFFERATPWLHRKLVAFRMYRFLAATPGEKALPEVGDQA